MNQAHLIFVISLLSILSFTQATSYLPPSNTPPTNLQVATDPNAPYKFKMDGKFVVKQYYDGSENCSGVSLNAIVIPVGACIADSTLSFYYGFDGAEKLSPYACFDTKCGMCITGDLELDICSISGIDLNKKTEFQQLRRRAVGAMEASYTTLVQGFPKQLASGNMLRALHTKTNCKGEVTAVAISPKPYNCKPQCSYTDDADVQTFCSADDFFSAAVSKHSATIAFIVIPIVVVLLAAGIGGFIFYRRRVSQKSYVAHRPLMQSGDDDDQN